MKFDLPPKTKCRLLVLIAETLQQVLKRCNVRDKVILLFLTDSRLRRAEVYVPNWDDVDLQSSWGHASLLTYLDLEIEEYFSEYIL